MSKENDAEGLLADLVSVASNEVHEDVEIKENEVEGTTISNTKEHKKFEQQFIKIDKQANNKGLGSIANYNGFSDDDDDSKDLLQGNESKFDVCTYNSKIKNVNPGPSWKKPLKPHMTVQTSSVENSNIYVDPLFGIRVVKPLISSMALKERMSDKDAVKVSRIKIYLLKGTQDKNWVIAGVIVAKSPAKTSKNGKKFMIWTLSDLSGNLETVSVFLFGNAFQDLWKTALGTVVGILNPSILDETKNSKDQAALSITTGQRVLIIGQSKDYGTCKYLKNNGEPCSAFVNLSQSEFCIYHIKQAYEKCRKRAEFQSGFPSNGLTALRNKVLGKNEVFYAGKSYTAIPAKCSKKQTAKDDLRLQLLSGVTSNKNLTAKGSQHSIATTAKGSQHSIATSMDISNKQRQKDLERLQKLGFNSEMAKSSCCSDKGKGGKVKENGTPDYTKKNVTSIATNVQPDFIDLNVDFKKRSILSPGALALLTGKKMVHTVEPKPCPKRFENAKQNAIKYVQQNGPLEKADPNNIKVTSSKKRPLLDSAENNLPKKQKQEQQAYEFSSERFKKIMATCSKHKDLLEHHDDEEQQKYFMKLEMKERLEEKMLNTYKVPCKAVKCLRCKYTSFSAADRCKEDKHPLRVYDAFKRFFKCGNCGNRTVSLDVVPLITCKNCGSGNWQRTSMMKEQKTEIAIHKLSIRGDEQKFVNSDIKDANLSLLMPDDS